MCDQFYGQCHEETQEELKQDEDFEEVHSKRDIESLDKMIKKIYYKVSGNKHYAHH